MNSREQHSTQKPRDPDFAGAEVAMRRAAKRARRRAEEAARAAASGGVEHELGEIHWFYYTGRDPRESGSGKGE
ncbi:MAG: hypothetical protein OXE44_12965 [Nitrospinae bacterium]|nr:hypothetical protein [Nitrospinota bacterium]